MVTQGASGKAKQKKKRKVTLHSLRHNIGGIYCALTVSPEGTYGLRSVRLSVSLSFTLFWILR
ncbi:hypothetical protein DPMN_052651 [Dreissena polymorpha]|uniref:Uncharacterized protein n=1 Tax=Dreissena polymorpha TaxID=45954 RepID=A0A9D4CKT6_DREPO|nr:hypothetical protein DPMN_052651 [Dreissena polymorpha]